MKFNYFFNSKWTKIMFRSISILSNFFTSTLEIQVNHRLHYGSKEKSSSKKSFKKEIVN